MPTTSLYQQSKPESIQEMFASISEQYDRANLLFSLGMHKLWNQKLIKAVSHHHTLLDLCAGTGEIGLHFLKKYPEKEAIFIDFCPEMLEEAKKKASPLLKARFIEGDAQAIPLSDQSVDAITISYGIRNVEDPLKCFVDAHRVLKEGGTLAILELTRPFFILRPFHKLYTHGVLPFLSRFVTKNRFAYRYLAKSVSQFCPPQHLQKLLEEAHFHIEKRSSLMGGIATLFVARKCEESD